MTTARGTLLVVLLVAVLVATSSAASNRKSKCPAEREREMDLCASRLGFLGDHSFRVPRNQSSAAAFCSQLKESINCIQGYSRDCLQGFTRQILQSLLKRGKQQFSSVCADQKARQSMMDKLSCLGGERITQLHELMDASIGRYEYIAGQVKPDVRLQGICCSYQLFQRDVDLTLDRVCGKPAQRAGSSNEFVHKIFSGTAGEFYQLICDGHRSLEECRASKRTAELMGELEGVSRRVQSGALRPKNRSLVPVLLEILDNSQQ